LPFPSSPYLLYHIFLYFTNKENFLSGLPDFYHTISIIN